jgi:hypothetical protein
MSEEVESYLAAASGGWDWVSGDGPAGPSWHVAWALHGLPTPIPTDLWDEVFSAVERRWGVESVIRGFKLASTMPAAHGSGVNPAEFADLARRYEQEVRRTRGAA